MANRFPTDQTGDLVEKSAMRTLTSLSFLAVESIGVTTEPSSPSAGDRYIVGSVSSQTINALNIDADDENLHVPSATPWSGWSGTSNFGIEVVVETTGSDMVVLHNRGSTGTKKLEISIDGSGRVVWEIVDGSGNNHKVVGTTPVNDGNPHVISVVRDGDNDDSSAGSRVHVDGGLDVKSSETINPVGDISPGEGLYIGLPPALSQTRQFNGRARELRVWSTDQPEVSISREANVVIDGDEENLALHLKIDEGSGSAAADNAGSNDGTLQDGADWGAMSNVFDNLVPSNAFEGHSDHIALWEGAQWTFFDPLENMVAWVRDEDKKYMFESGVGWRANPGGGQGGGGDDILTDYDNPGDVLQRRGDGVVLVER